MKYTEFKKQITGEGVELGEKEFYIVPLSLEHKPLGIELEDFPKLSELEISMSTKKGEKIINFSMGFPDPNNVYFFFDKEKAEAHTVFLMTRQRMKLIRALEEFDRKTDYKGRFQTSFDKFPEVFL